MQAAYRCLTEDEFLLWTVQRSHYHVLGPDDSPPWQQRYAEKATLRAALPDGSEIRTGGTHCRLWLQGAARRAAPAPRSAVMGTNLGPLLAEASAQQGAHWCQ